MISMERCNLQEAQQFLMRFYEDLNQLKCLKKDEWSNLEEFEATFFDYLNLNQNEILNKNLHLTDEEKLTQMKMIRNSLTCFIFNKQHDTIIQMVYKQHEKEDAYLCQKCKFLCEKNITADQMGAPKDYSLQFLAAIVELASLDTRKSPIEKLHCLCTTYDMIFAELKAALIDIISKFSDKENDIPVINNEDVIPVLMLVITKSKPVHLYSNLFYIEHFLWTTGQVDNISYVINEFKMAVKKLMDLNDLKPPSSETFQDINLIKLISISEEMKTAEHNDKHSLLYWQKERIANLILASTSEVNE